MKYVRIVIAIPEEDCDKFSEVLDVFIEECDYVEGAYISGMYDTRQEALGTDFKDPA